MVVSTRHSVIRSRQTRSKRLPRRKSNTPHNVSFIDASPATEHEKQLFTKLYNNACKRETKRTNKQNTSLSLQRRQYLCLPIVIATDSGKMLYTYGNIYLGIAHTEYCICVKDLSKEDQTNIIYSVMQTVTTKNSDDNTLIHLGSRHPVKLRRVDSTQLFLICNLQRNTPGHFLPLTQIVLPDVNGNFPDEPKYNWAEQPLLPPVPPPPVPPPVTKTTTRTQSSCKKKVSRTQKTSKRKLNRSSWHKLWSGWPFK